MRLEFTYRNNNNRLLLIFAGWGMDALPFKELRCNSYDIAIIWDYRSTQIDTTAFKSYGEIAIFAWSMGVFIADRILPRLKLPLSCTIAINGTQWPIDNERGIQEQIFNGTLQGLNERSLLKFYRRMCGSSEVFALFQKHLPQRQIGELKAELQAIQMYYAELPDQHLTWDKAIVADNDAIIPTTNQLKAWDNTEIILIPGTHIPNWSSLIETLLIDKNLVRDRFTKGFVTYDSAADAQIQIADTLWELWQTLGTIGHTRSLIEIGYGTGIFTHKYESAVPVVDWQLWDIVSPTIKIPNGATVLTGDAEAMIHTIPPSSIDKIVSASAIQWFNSLPVFFQQAQRCLISGGELILSTFGPLTFRELSAAGAKPLPYPDMETIRRYLSNAGFSIVHISDQLIVKQFNTPHEVLRHIQATGVNAISGHTTPAKVRKILQTYPRLQDGSTTLTYQPIYIIATKP